jgi:mRNA interferase MazF
MPNVRSRWSRPRLSQIRPCCGWGETRISAWREAGLLTPSVVKPVFATLEQALVIRRLGTLNAEDQAALRKAIVEVVG